MTPLANPSTRPPAPRIRRASPRRRRESGIGILQAMIVIVLVGAVVVAGVTLLRSTAPADQAAQQEQSLRWADEAIIAYAAVHARLPCPVTSPTAAPTDCVAPGQKGWLPTRALEAVHPGGAGPTQPMRYVVYRGAGESDLAVASNAFSPHRWDRVAHSLDPINGLDLCAKLGTAARDAGASHQGGLARTVDVSGTPVNIAFGIVAPGPMPGSAGGRFDGLNQDAAAVVEAPSRVSDSSYDDRTRVRDFDSLAQALGCGFATATQTDGVAMASLDMLGLAVDVSDEVNEQHEGNKEDTQLAVVMSGVSVAFAGINVALAGASIANSVSTTATASAQLTAAIASCAVLVGCGLIPPYTAAVIAGKIAIGLSTTATAAATAALATSSAALAETIVARDMAEAGLPSAAIDLSAVAEVTCLGAEGGFVTQVADANGNLTTVDPPQFRPGLRQEVEAATAELAALQAERLATGRRISELEQIPSRLLIRYPPRPTRANNESDASFNARIAAWEQQKREMDTLLVLKLDAIRMAKRAQFAYETSQQALVNAEKELADMQESVAYLTPIVAACSATPPADIVERRRCENHRRALLGMTTCDASILTASEVRDRQCVRWKTEDRDAAIAERDSRFNAFRTAEDLAVNAAQPPIMPYIPIISPTSPQGCVPPINTCAELIVDERSWAGLLGQQVETYAELYYRFLGYDSALREKESDLAEKQAAYDSAKAQCDTLRALRPGGSGSGVTSPPAWAGANAIMQAANCRGATGAVQPNVCGSVP